MKETDTELNTINNILRNNQYKNIKTQAPPPPQNKTQTITLNNKNGLSFNTAERKYEK
jgi:hypothetical protein